MSVTGTGSPIGIDNLVERNNSMKARIYGSANRQGPIKEFAVVEKLPTKGEPVMLGEPDFIWGGAEKAMLDPEQRHRDENELGDYDFYVVPEINVEDGEAVAVHYFAVRRPEPVLITEYAIINHGIEKAPYHNEDVLFESQDSEEIVAKLQDESDLMEMIAGELEKESGRTDDTAVTDIDGENHILAFDLMAVKCFAFSLL